MLKAELRILVVEDEAVFRHSLVSYLSRDGATVFQAEDGIEALSAATLYHPDVVLCDLNMPNMDGHEVIACLSARYPHIPVIVISAQSTMEAVASALRAGARDYLLNPLEDYALVDRSIEQYLNDNANLAQQLELMDHIDYFSAHDKEASRLLAGLKPPGLQEWGPLVDHFQAAGAAHHGNRCGILRCAGAFLDERPLPPVSAERELFAQPAAPVARLLQPSANGVRASPLFCHGCAAL